MNNFLALFAKMGLAAEQLNDLAHEMNFKKRKSVLKATDLIILLLSVCMTETISYNAMASTLATLSEQTITVSKVAVFKALRKKALIPYLQKVFWELLNTDSNRNKLYIQFNRIIIQDSTIIRLPQRLFAIFSGVKNAVTQVATARIQIAIDLVSNTLERFAIDWYSRNDITVAAFLRVQKNDLILRDRGYLSIAEMERIAAANAFFIYRYAHTYTLFCPDTGKQINLLKYLQRRGQIDQQVKLRSANGMQIRMVTQPVPQDVANQRRRQAKKNNKFNTSKENLLLMNWDIYIVNLPTAQYDHASIVRLYRLRWRIENIFKALKSNLHLDAIHNVSEHQLRYILLIKMIFYMLIAKKLYVGAQAVCKDQFNCELSLLKLTTQMVKNINLLLEMIVALHTPEGLTDKHLKFLMRYCCYDKRKRVNMNQKINAHLNP
jgi:Transposase DDE domain